jgi:hypothetical protein
MILHHGQDLTAARSTRICSSVSEQSAQVTPRLRLHGPGGPVASDVHRLHAALWIRSSAPRYPSRIGPNQVTACDELRALRERRSASPFVFASERGGPFTSSGFAKLLCRVGETKLEWTSRCIRMLRHACGTPGLDTRTLQAYLGHRWQLDAMPRWLRDGSRIFGERGRRPPL